jgi:hypothetical protein
MEPIPAYLRPVLIDDQDTLAGRAVQERARRLLAHPLDVIERLGALDLTTGRNNPRDTNAAVWLCQHPEWLDRRAA